MRGSRAARELRDRGSASCRRGKLLAAAALAITLAIEVLNLLQLLLGHPFLEPLVARVAEHMLLEQLFCHLLAGNLLQLGDELEVERLGHVIHAVPPGV